jgi:holo-[acyl-carrier protein] synthase
MILGLGIDVVEVDRIRASLGKFGERFLKRILRQPEIDYCLSFKHPAVHVAARFAAKEAIAKAFGTGISRQLSWLDMEVGRKESGEPFVIIHGPGQALLEQRGAVKILLSLSHTDRHAVAVAILEGG